MNDTETNDEYYVCNCNCDCIMDFDDEEYNENYMCKCDCSNIDGYNYCYNLHMNTFTIFHNIYHPNSINGYIENQRGLLDNVLNIVNFINNDDFNKTNKYCEMIVGFTDYKDKYIELLTKSTGLPKEIVKHILIDYCSPIDMYNHIENTDSDEYFDVFHNNNIYGLNDISNTFEICRCGGEEYIIYRTEDLHKTIYGYNFNTNEIYELQFERVDIYGYNTYRWLKKRKNYSFIGDVKHLNVINYDNDNKKLEFICV